MRTICLGLIIGIGLCCVAPAEADLSNGDFGAGLSDWVLVGPVSDGGGSAVLAENSPGLRTTLSQQFILPANSLSLSFRYTIAPGPGGPAGSLFPDAFIVGLLDPVTKAPLLSTPGYSDYYYHDNSGLVDYDPSIVTVSGERVSLSVASLAGGTDALLTFDLLGVDNGVVTEVQVGDIEVTPIPAPSAIALGAVGLAVVGRFRRRSRTVE